MKQKGERLPPRDPKGGRPPQQLAARLGVHILDIALEQFIARGAEGASMEAIALAANVSKRTLYSRFGSKTGLLYAALDHGHERLAKPIIARGIPNGSLRDQLLATARKMLDATLKPETLGLETLAYWVNDHCPRPGGEAGASYHIGVQTIRNNLDRAITREELIVPDPEFMAGLVFDALIVCPRHRILRRRTLANATAAKDEYLSKTLDILLEGILAPSHKFATERDHPA